MLSPSRLSSTTLHVLIERLTGIAPCIALVVDKTLKNRDRHGLVVCPDIFEGSSQRWTMEKVHGRQNPANLQIRVDSSLKTPIHFQEDTITICHRRIALLRLQDRRVQGGPAAYQIPIGLRGGRNQNARFASETATSLDGRQQRPRKVWAPKRIVQYPDLFAIFGLNLQRRHNSIG